MVKKWSEFVTKKPWTVIGLIVLVSLFFTYFLKNLRFENGFVRWMPKSDYALRLFVDTGEKFGTNELIMVTLKAKNGDTFSPEILRRVKEVTDELEEKKEIFLVTSISNAPDVKKIGDGIEVRNLVGYVPEDKEKLARLKRYVLSRESFVNNVISKDGMWLSIAIFLRSGENIDPIKSFSEVVRPTIEKYFKDVAEIYYSGDPSDTYYGDQISKMDLKTLMPIAAVVILIILLFSFRNFQGVLYPSFVVSLTVLWTFGTIGLLNRPMNILTPVLPVFLIALGSAYGIHVVNKMLHGDSVSKATFEIFVPVFMAGVTTIVGFASFATAKLSLFVELGLFSAAGIFYAMVISLSLIPALWSLGSKGKGFGEGNGKPYRYNVIPRSLSKMVLSRPLVLLLIFFVVFVFFVIWIPKIQREVDFSQYFPEDSMPRKSLRIIKEHFGGAYPLTIYMKTQDARTPETLKIMRRAENYLYSLGESSLPFGLPDFIQEINYQLNGRYTIPETKGEISNLWFFMEGRSELHQVLSDDNRESIILTKYSEANTFFMKKVYGKVSEFLKEEADRGFESYRLSNLSEEKRELVREEEKKYIEKEIGWIGEKYGVKIERGFLRGIPEKLPSAWEPEVLKIIKSEIGNYIFSDEFDFEIGRRTKEAVFKKIISSIDSEDDPEFTEIMKEYIPKDKYDKETALDVSSTFEYRIKEAKRKVFVGRAWGIVKGRLNSGNANLKKKIKGLLWELADNLAILPYGTLPFRGKKVKIEEIRQSGFPSAMTRLDHFLFTSQLQSLGIALILTFILMFALRRSFSLALISITPVIFTIGVIYGFLGLSGIPLDYATMMIAGVSIGVGIDYAIHFIHGILIERGKGRELRRAVELAYLEKGKAILSNSVAVMAGFAVLLFSSLRPLRHFGITMVGSMFLAAVAALTILPALALITLGRNKKEVKNDRKNFE